MIVRTLSRALVVTSCAVVLAACGSSSGASPGGSDASSSIGPTVASSPDAATVAAVTQAYQTFFAPASTAAQVEGAIQNGARFHDAIAAEGSSKYTGTSGVKVEKVVVQSPDVAHVTFSVTSNGSVVLPGASGYAVRVDGSWKLAATTFCQLLTLEGTAPATCRQAAATALPS